MTSGDPPPRERLREQLREQLADRGFTPPAKVAPLLLELLGDPNEAVVKLAERALVRAEPTWIAPSREELGKYSDVVRARLCRVLGPLAAKGVDVARARLLDALLDEAAIVRRYAASALGRACQHGEADVEEALTAALAKEASGPERKAMTVALGKVGRERAKEHLVAHAARSGDEAEAANRALLMIERTVTRSVSPGALREHVAPALPLPVAFYCRRGLEPLVVRELERSGFDAKPRAGEVRAMLAVDLHSAMLASRMAIDFGFVLAPRRIERGDVAEAIAATLSTPAANHLFATFTDGRPRFRLSFSGGAHKRAVAWRVAERVRALCPALLNDPTESTWEARVHAAEGEVRVALVPRALPDTRFDYRVKDVPASSHPTIAAALAFVARPDVDDVIWDPFVGSGSELVELARREPAARGRIGSDVDVRALDAARTNLAAAKVEASLVQADARTHRVPHVSLVVTNPPMGRRLRPDGGPSTLLSSALSNALGQLAAFGRVVWLTPMPRDTDPIALEAGFEEAEGYDVDLGGYTARMQRLVRRLAPSRSFALR